MIHQRKAVLIASQSPKGDYLPGIGKDVDNFKHFLLSPNGGAMHSADVTVLKDPSCQQVKDACQRADADFYQVYVSSHGYTNYCNERVICLTDGDLLDVDLFNDSDRQTVIPDACRKRPEGAAIGGIPWPQEKWKYATGDSAARDWFDSAIQACPYGEWIFHGTATNTFAFGSDDGGIFTNSLLDVIYDLQQTGAHEYLSLPFLIQQAAIRMAAEGSRQVPEQVWGGDASLLPFAIISPEFIPRIVRRPHQTQTETSKALFALGGLALGLYALSKIE